MNGSRASRLVAAALGARQMGKQIVNSPADFSPTLKTLESDSRQAEPRHPRAEHRRHLYAVPSDWTLLQVVLQLARA